MAARLALSSLCHKNEYICSEDLRTKFRHFNDNLSEPRFPRLKDLQDFADLPANVGAAQRGCPVAAQIGAGKLANLGQPRWVAHTVNSAIKQKNFTKKFHHGISPSTFNKGASL